MQWVAFIIPEAYSHTTGVLFIDLENTVNPHMYHRTLRRAIQNKRHGILSNGI